VRIPTSPSLSFVDMPLGWILTASTGWPLSRWDWWVDELALTFFLRVCSELHFFSSFRVKQPFFNFNG
jgi:hypothetical protein